MRHVFVRRGVLGACVLLALLLGAGASAFGGDGVPRASGLTVAGGSGVSEGSGEPSDAAVTPPSVASPSPSAVPSGSGNASGTTLSGAGPAPVATPAEATAPAGCPQGERQLEVETALAALGTYGPVTVDGVVSAADCAAVTAFQKRFGISPANGRAGPLTGEVAKRIAASNTPAELAKCGAGATGVVACINLTLQTVWLVRDGSVVWGPTVTRTGMRGYATPAGTFRITNRNIKEWSIKYKVWLPYWQHFTRGMGFHETTTYIHTSGIGSHGCVNLLRSDAKELWGLIGNGTTVKTFGRRPGT